MSRITRKIVLLVAPVALVTAGLAVTADRPLRAEGRSTSPEVRAQRPPGPLPGLPHRVAPSSIPRLSARTLRAEPAPLPSTAKKEEIEPAECRPDALAFGVPVSCGYVKVPLDWKHPGKLGKIKIYFELYVPEHSGAAASAILQNYGGPGASTTSRRWLAFYYFGANLDEHDLLLIDDRGRGLSTTIVCDSLQHGTAPWAEAVADCAAQLGETASRFGTGEVAQDTDAVREALGYDKVDYFGWSYGGADIEAYATRFGEHLRSIVLDAPVGSPYLDPLRFDWARVQGDRRLVRLQCGRSPSCSPDHPFPDHELALLAQSIRRHPVEGDAYDSWGTPRHVRIDEKVLLNAVIDNPTSTFVSTGEVLAAGSALRRGDALPLLRLGAEQLWTAEWDAGDPESYSTGALMATSCVDFQQHWDWSAPVAERQAQYAAAIRELPPWFYFPFSKQTVTGLLYDFFGTQCLSWEVPTRPAPLVPKHPRYPHVPTLVLAGDSDQRVPLEVTSKVARLYPDALFVPVASAGHPSLLWSTCAARLASEFVRDLEVADPSCAGKPDVAWPAVGRFPRLAGEARPAEVDPTGVNEIGIGERRVVTVAVAAAKDALQRTTIWFPPSGPGLRGGSFATDYGDWSVWTLTLTEAAFAEDVKVSGTVAYRPSPPAWLGTGGDGSFTADLVVAGPGTEGGTLHVEGRWLARGAEGKLEVTGTLGGKKVAVLVPEA